MRLLTIIALIWLLAACSTTPTQPTLYERLGEQEGITTIVDNLLYEIGGNDTLLPFFAATNISRFREKLIEQLCQVSDGPCDYTGDSMAQVHAGMDLNDSHFNALVTDLVAAMDEAGVATGAQNDLLARLVPMYDEVMNPDDYINAEPTDTDANRVTR
ncbi:group I truncated hemoglobin [Saccharospirillum impatiens]|uniref:group I truncated hemoglobin n=1 Tax=Saccharospirillum impatiens TaxID=169438 RepID=UPI00040B9B1F|nr:group 1 truncated hemoglobin [Saccharospirillum impatiens]